MTELRLYSVTVHASSGPHMVLVLARTAELAKAAARRQLRQSATVWAHAHEVQD